MGHLYTKVLEVFFTAKLTVSNCPAAKILKIRNFTPEDTENGEIGPNFLVHYKGWKQTQVDLVFDIVSTSDPGNQLGRMGNGTTHP